MWRGEVVQLALYSISPADHLQYNGFTMIQHGKLQANSSSWLAEKLGAFSNIVEGVIFCRVRIAKLAANKEEDEEGRKEEASRDQSHDATIASNTSRRIDLEMS